MNRRTWRAGRLPAMLCLLAILLPATLVGGNRAAASSSAQVTAAASTPTVTLWSWRPQDASGRAYDERNCQDVRTVNCGLIVVA